MSWYSKARTEVSGILVARRKSLQPALNRRLHNQNDRTRLASPRLPRLSSSGHRTRGGREEMTDVAKVNTLHASAMEVASRASFRLIFTGITKRLSPYSVMRSTSAHRAASSFRHDLAAEPSRSILLRSAASLALDCREHREAERLIAIALSGDPPLEIGDELRDLLENVYFSRHIALHGLVLDPLSFQMSMAGGAVGFGVMESGQFLRRAESLERLIIRTAERLRGLPFRETGPTKGELDDFKVYYSTARAASFAITVRLSRPERQLRLDFSGNIEPAAIVDDVLACIDDFSGGHTRQLRERIIDDTYFNNFTALAKKLAPDGKRIRTVGFTATRGDVQRVVALTTPPPGVWEPEVNDARSVEFVGRIRAADETSKTHDHPFLCVESDDGKTSPRIRVVKGLLQDIVRPYWGELVRVIATKGKRGPHEMVRIELVESKTSPNL